jgi:FkbM family methyltransferase
MAFTRRLRVVSRWLTGHRNGVSASQLARFVSGPTCAVESRQFIESVTEEGEDVVVRLRGVERPLHWPKGEALYPLYMVLAETFNPANWHFYEVAETRVGADDIVADCGAAEGIFALQVYSRAKRVYAIEPSPHWTASLARTFQGATNVIVLPAALGATAGEAYLSGGALDSELSADGRNGGHAVVVETIDRLFADRDQPLTYLKADLEGFELEMLEGARRTIARYRPKIAITTYHRADHAERIAAFLRDVDAGYRVRTKGIDADTGSPVMLHAWIPAGPS